MRSAEQRNCAIYCRYSSETQRDRMSIEAQRRACLEFAAKQGWTVSKVYVDEARSGTSDEREAFQEMMAEGSKKQSPFHIVLVHKLDRFARNRYDSITYKQILKKHGIRVVSATQPITGSGDPTEVILEAVLEGMDEFYSLNLAREAIKGMSENARRGWWNGGFAPFGYRLVEIQTEKGPKRKLEIEESEAAVVRRIFEEYLQGAGVNVLRRRLNEEGLKLRGGYRFTTNSLLYMLRNEKYAGDCTFGKHPNPRRAAIDMHFEPITVRESHPAIIDRKAWEAAQQKLSRQRRESKHPRASSSGYLLAGLIECAFCGNKFIGSGAHGNGGHYRYYVCGTVVRSGPKACQQRKFNAQDLERVLIATLQTRLTSRQMIKDLITSRNALLRQAQEQQSRLLPKLEQEIQAVERKRTRLFEVLEETLTLNRDDIAPRLHDLASLKVQKELERDQLKARLAMRPAKVSEEVIQELVAFYKAMFQDQSFWAQKRLVQSFMVSVKIDAAYACLTYDPSFTVEQDRIPIGGEDDGGPDPEGPEPPPKGSYEVKMAGGQGFEP